MRKGSPVMALHPSVIIQEELDARGWDLDMLAMRMGPEFGLHRLALDMYFIVGPKRTNMTIGKKSAKALGRALGVDPQFFLNLCKQWRESTIAAKQLKDGKSDA